MSTFAFRFFLFFWVGSLVSYLVTLFGFLGDAPTPSAADRRVVLVWATLSVVGVGIWYKYANRNSDDFNVTGTIAVRVPPRGVRERDWAVYFENGRRQNKRSTPLPRSKLRSKLIKFLADKQFDNLLDGCWKNPGASAPLLVTADYCEENDQLELAVALRWMATRKKYPLTNFIADRRTFSWDPTYKGQKNTNSIYVLRRGRVISHQESYALSVVYLTLLLDKVRATLLVPGDTNYKEDTK